jgi:hypothetical protein
MPGADDSGSLLASISNYYITDQEDIQCLLCIAPQCAETFLSAVESRLARETAGRLREIFENSTTGGQG